jgi:hypothetical protein
MLVQRINLHQHLHLWICNLHSLSFPFFISKRPFLNYYPIVIIGAMAYWCLKGVSFDPGWSTVIEGDTHHFLIKPTTVPNPIINIG